MLYTPLRSNISLYMKTSIEISDSLFKRARQLANQRKSSVRSLVEEGLRLLFANIDSRRKTKPKLLTFGGDGLTDEMKIRGLSWDTLRSEIYKDHGA